MSTPKINRSISITGISEMQCITLPKLRLLRRYSRDGPAYITTAFILRLLTKYLSNRVNTAYHWKHVTGLELADRDPISSDPIDIIIELAGLFGMLVLDGIRKGSEHEPIAQNTLGWILS